MYVIVKKGSGLSQYATRPGSIKSYTKDLTQARTFRDYNAAARECCGNEVAVNVESLLQNPG